MENLRIESGPVAPARWPGSTISTLCLLLLVAGCGESASPGGPAAPPRVEPTPLPSPAASPSPLPVDETLSATLTHDFGELILGPGEEIASQCVAWTLDNEEALYVQAITLTNPGSSHHSNWFVVPETEYEGPDGFFRCRSREFSELGAAVAGTVIFAQSTQSLVEEQRFREGAVVKIPPRHKVVAGVHFLNLAPREIRTGLRLSLELTHPRQVNAILSPFRYTYYALDIDPRSRERVAIECDMATAFAESAGKPMDLTLHWVLPHTHYLGDHFRVEIVGGERDGEILHELNTFNADANGKALDPPLDLSDATGLRVTCGFRNPRDESVGWGIGDQEMCVMLGLAETEIMMDLAVNETTDESGLDDGIPLSTGPCEILAVPRNPAQSPPTEAELESPLYVPETQPGDIGLPVVPPCEDTAADAVPEKLATFDDLNRDIFMPFCNFAACHGSITPAAGLDLETDPYRALIDVPATAGSGLLVAPGNPAESWLYSVLSRCEPEDASGVLQAHMPRNSPTLLDPALVAEVRDWILDGAAR